MLEKTMILQPSGNIGGAVEVISSKSELHRLIICACLSDTGCTIKYTSSLSEDIIATIGCFRSLGAEISVCDGKIAIESPVNRKYIEENINENTEIFCNESGSTARFILPVLSVLCKNGAVLTGKGRLPERPFSDLCRCLEAHGASFSSDRIPIEIKNTATPKGVLEISGNISSQYLSGLLFILPLFPDCKIKLTTPLESSGYVDMTIDAMKKFGVTVCEKDGVYTANGEYRTKEKTIIAGGDWSNGSFFLCASGEKELTVKGLCADSLQPDRKILEILSSCGYNVTVGQNEVKVKRGENIKPFDTDAGETPDSVPVLSVLAASVCGTSIIRNTKRLKYKESDRVKSVCDMIENLGGNAKACDDCIIVQGTGRLSGGKVNSFGDHRIAMAAAVASLICEREVVIEGADAVAKSYPEFFTEFKKLMGENE